MNVVGFAGFSGSGKTTLIEGVIPALKRQGFSVSVVKHAHQHFDIDHPGKDSFRHRAAGAFEVVVASSRRLALMREFGREQPPSVHALIAELDPRVDWVLVEGFKDSDIPKLEVWRAQAGHPARYAQDPRILAVATDDAIRLPEPVARPVLDLNDAPSVARWLVAHAAQFHYRTEVPK